MEDRLLVNIGNQHKSEAVEGGFELKKTFSAEVYDPLDATNLLLRHNNTGFI